MDKRGVLIFLISVFLLEAALLCLDRYVLASIPVLRTLIFLLVFWTPAIAAFIARQVSAAPQLDAGTVWPVPVWPALRIALLVFLVFAVIHVFVGILGLAPVEWGLGTLMNPLQDVLVQMGQPALDPATERAGRALLLVAMPVLTLVLGATLFGALALGSELGWRGFLLPRLMPLGAVPAQILAGLLWAGWLLAIYYPTYVRPDSILPQAFIVPRFLLTATLVGVVLGEIWRRSAHLGLCAVALGVFLAQLQGVWLYLFSVQRPPWTGAFGIIALLVWLAAACMPSLFISHKAQSQLVESGADAEALETPA